LHVFEDWVGGHHIRGAPRMGCVPAIAPASMWREQAIIE